VPAGYFDSGTGSCAGVGTYFQLRLLAKTPVVATLGTPAKPQVVRTYDLSAYCRENERVHQFDKPLKIFVYYSDSEIAGLEESQLEIFRYD